MYGIAQRDRRSVKIYTSLKLIHVPVSHYEYDFSHHLLVEIRASFPILYASRVPEEVPWVHKHKRSLYSFFSCDQAALWMVFSVRLSVCLSVCPSVCLSVCPCCPSVTPFWLCSHHRIIMKFSGVITLDQGKVHAKGQGQRSKVKVTEVTTQIFVSGL